MIPVILCSLELFKKLIFSLIVFDFFKNGVETLRLLSVPFFFLEYF